MGMTLRVVVSETEYVKLARKAKKEHRTVPAVLRLMIEEAVKDDTAPTMLEEMALKKKATKVVSGG